MVNRGADVCNFTVRMYSAHEIHGRLAPFLLHILYEIMDGVLFEGCVLHEKLQELSNQYRG
ncbi:hypothetical protein GCM10010912_64630 [Paenibacillus albidus]|uniref:Uncharacterized protein n=1 Tax=Paenibacillus albidus TaxID=2041023 RepID=A0A917D6E1_9BACL|nr:hypothetical protein GCM10010912_64630 [Paenibacillus albidus]